MWDAPGHRDTFRPPRNVAEIFDFCSVWGTDSHGIRPKSSHLVIAREDRTEDGRPYDDRHRLLPVTDDDVEHAATGEPPRDGDGDDGPGIRELLGLGGMLAGCVVAGVIVGLFVDARLGSSPSGVLVGTAVGILAAGIGFWLRIRAYLQGR